MARKIELGNRLVIELGLASLDAAQQQHIRQRFQEVLEFRIGTQLMGVMSSRKVAESEDLMSRGEANEAREWLAAQFPEYPVVVWREYQTMVEFIRRRVHEGKRRPDDLNEAAGATTAGDSS